MPQILGNVCIVGVWINKFRFDLVFLFGLIGFFAMLLEVWWVFLGFGFSLVDLLGVFGNLKSKK